MKTMKTMKQLLIGSALCASSIGFAGEMHHDEHSQHTETSMPMAQTMAKTMATMHTLLDSTPYEEQMMMGSPTSIELSFAQPVRLTSLTLVNDDGSQIDLAFTASDRAASQFSHPIAELPMGSYTLHYQVQGNFADHLNDNLNNNLNNNLNEKNSPAESGAIWFMVH